MRDPVQARQRDERLLARRHANQGPDKLRYPGLTGGLVAGSGEFFPQGIVSSNGRKGLFDDLVGAGWCIVAKPGVIDALSERHREAWKALGGRIAIIAGAPGPGVLEDVDGTYSRWFAEHSCPIAMMRPDWYVYGTASDVHELAELLDRLSGSLQPRATLIS